MAIKFCTIFIVFLYVYNFANSCELKGKVQKQCLEGSVIRTKQPYGIKNCIKLCMETKGCVSINHRRNTFTCELNSAKNSSTLSTTPNEDCTYIEMEENMKSIQRCLPDTCSKYDTCVESKNRGTVCLKSSHKIKLDGVKTGSSSYYAGQNAYVPSRAIDRNLATFFASGLEYSTFPYWWMELNSVNINKVVVLKRSGLTYRFRDITLWIGTSLQDLHICDTYAGPDTNITAEFICNVTMPSSVIKFEHKGPVSPNPATDNDYRILTMVEVYIYGFYVKMN